MLVIFPELVLVASGTIHVSWSWLKGQYLDDVLTFCSYVNFRGKILLFKRIRIVLLNFEPPKIMLSFRDNGYLLGDPPPPCYLKLSFGQPPLPLLQ